MDFLLAAAVQLWAMAMYGWRQAAEFQVRVGVVVGVVVVFKCNK